MTSLFLRRLLPVAALLVAATGPVLAQAPSTGGPAPAAAVTPVPLDGGASLLLAGGLAYGLKRLRNRRRAAQA